MIWKTIRDLRRIRFDIARSIKDQGGVLLSISKYFEDQLNPVTRITPDAEVHFRDKYTSPFSWQEAEDREDGTL